MKVEQTEEIPVRPNTTVSGFDYVVVDGDKFVLAVMMDNGDKLRLSMYASKPNPNLQHDNASVALIDFKLSALTGSSMSRSPDLMAVLLNFVGKEVDPNRPQYIQLRINSDNIESYEGANHANA